VTGRGSPALDEPTGDSESSAAYRFRPLHPHESEQVIDDNKERSEKQKDHQYAVFHMPDPLCSFGTTEDRGAGQMRGSEEREHVAEMSAPPGRKPRAVSLAGEVLGHPRLHEYVWSARDARITRQPCYRALTHEARG